jgi:hypothetical protein
MAILKVASRKHLFETKGGVIGNLGLGSSVAAMAARCAPSAPRGLAGKMVTAHLSDRAILRSKRSN